MSQIAADLRDFLPLLLAGAATTIGLTACALVLSVVLGAVWTAMRLSRSWVLRGVALVVINVTRGIPILVQLFYVYFVLPDLGIRLNAFVSGVVGLGMAYSVYQAENFRGGLASVDPALIEAVQALGMNERTILRRVRIPLALRTVLPPFGNTAIMLLKDSSIASTITVAELTRNGQILAVSTFKNMEIYTLVALLYLTMSLPLSFATRRLERRYAHK